MRIVIDTNILVSALLNPATAPREVLRLSLARDVQPLMGAALFGEYRDVLGRDRLFEGCPLNGGEREELFAALCNVCEWVTIRFLWRPNLPDEGDNHLIELAVAGGADVIVSANRRDLAVGELLFPGIRIMTAGEFLKERTG